MFELYEISWAIALVVIAYVITKKISLNKRK